MRPPSEVTRRCCYTYVFKYTASNTTHVQRDGFAAATQAEGIPVRPSIYPLLHRLACYTAYEQRLLRTIYGTNIEWPQCSFPVAERAADEEGCTTHLAKVHH